MLDISALSGDGATKVLSGKQRGEKARSEFAIESYESPGEDVSVKLAPELEAITPSFVLGMFGSTVRKCGTVDAFLQKFRFETKPHILAQLRRGAEYSLVKGDPLPF